MRLCHNSHLSEYRSPFGAASIGSSVTLSIDVADVSCNEEPVAFLDCSFEGSLSSIRMRSFVNGDGAYRFQADLTVSYTPGVCWYTFRIIDGCVTYLYGNNSQRFGGEGCIYEADPIPYQITVYRPDHIPDWYRKGIVYQIFPDRFARSERWEEHQAAAQSAYEYGVTRDLSYTGVTGSEGEADFSEKLIRQFPRPERSVENDWSVPPHYPRNASGGVSEWIFSGGDLAGIRDKLGYLKDLGISVIYLNPIFKASSNHKYDTADYMQIDEAFGSEEDFISLCSAAREMGIHIILDGVFSHTGADSRYFDIYDRFDEPGACQGEESPYYPWYTFTDDEYESWWGVPDLPNVREMTRSYQDFIYGSPDSVIRKWLRLGASGWRLDVADELPDEFIQGIRSAMLEESPDSLLLGEVWEDASHKESYGELRKYFSGYELQSTMNYPFRAAALDYIKGRTDAFTFASVLTSLQENYPPENFYAALNLIGSHDRIRILTELADGPESVRARLEDTSAELSDEEQKLVSSGISRSDAIRECWHIPEEKKWLAYSRLKAMSLMQFVMPGVPCIYYGDEAGMEGFEDPYCRGNFPWGSEDASLTEHFRFLCSLKNDHPVLTDGDFHIYGLSGHVVCMERSDGSERIRLIVNRGIFEWEDIPSDTALSGTDLLTGNVYSGEGCTLPPLGVLLLSENE